MLSYNSLEAVANRGGFSVIASLNDLQAHLILSLLVTYAANPRVWDEGDIPASYDEIDDLVSQTQAAIMNSALIGAILPFAATPDTERWLICDGSQYDTAYYPALAGFLSETGPVFNVPDLRDRFMRGGVVAGGTGGANTINLSVSQLPAHTHGYNTPIPNVDVEGAGVPDPTGAGFPLVGSSTSSAGSGADIDNQPSYYGVIYAIAAR